MLKEELDKKPKKGYYHFVSVVDTFDGKSSQHGERVRSLVLSRKDEDNELSVLPPISNNEVMSEVESTKLRQYVNEWFTFAEEKCSSAPSPYECKKKIIPSVINFSMVMYESEVGFQRAAILEKALNSPVGSEERKKAIAAFPEFKKLFESDLNNLDAEGKEQLWKVQYAIEIERKVAHESGDYHQFKKLTENGNVIVMSAGNSNTDNPIQPVEVKAAKDLGVILVGAIGPRGVGVSQEHQAIHITAPGKRVSTVDEAGNIKDFNGTSAAAPLVSGTLGAFIWQTGYSPTAEEAKILLEKTAIPHEHYNDKPRKNGVGMLNAYKIGMVAKKLAVLCGDNSSCFKRAIHTDATYISNDFTSGDLQNLERNLDHVFPACRLTGCESGSQKGTSSCKDQNALLNKLRKVAFLKPKEKKWWRHLACIYRYNGFSEENMGALATYKAIALSERADNIKAAYYCRSDVDCVLIPNHVGFFPTTLLEAEGYYNNSEGWRYCNKKCRCGNEEEVISGSKRIQYQSICRGSTCVLKETEEKILGGDSDSGQPSEGNENFGKPDNFGNQPSTHPDNPFIDSSEDEKIKQSIQ